MGQATEHSRSSPRLLEGGEPDPVRALKGETRRTTKLPLLTDSHRALPLLLILSAREL